MRKGTRHGFTFIASLMAATMLMSGTAFAGEQEQEQEKLTVGVVYKLRSEYFDRMQIGVDRAAEEFGVDVSVAYGEDHDAIDSWIAAVQDLIVKDVDGLVVTPQDSVACVPVIVDAIEAGIPVVVVDNRLDADTVKDEGYDPEKIPFVSVADYNSGYLAATEMAEKLEGKGNVAILEGLRGADNSEQRKQGALDAFAEYEGITVVAQQSAEWSDEKAMNICTDIVTSNPDINGFVCANDNMAIGCVRALEAAGRSEDVFVCGIDAMAEAVELVKEDKLLATVYASNDMQGYTGLKSLVDLINGEQPPAEYLVDPIAVTKENAEDF